MIKWFGIVSNSYITKTRLPLELCTFRRSFLSARRATTSPIKYIPNRKHTVERTTKFPVSPSLLNSVQTLSKSMGFGATKMFPPNAERWVHKQCSFPSVCLPPTLKESKELSVFFNVENNSGRLTLFVSLFVCVFVTDWLTVVRGCSTTVTQVHQSWKCHWLTVRNN